MFFLNDIIVYPGYGVAKIQQEISKNIGGCLVKLYELSFMNKDVTILVPVDGMKSVGIRRLSSKEDILNIFTIFCSPLSASELADLGLSSWNRRSKEYQNKIRNGNLNELAIIYRDFKTVEKQKNLSFGEKAIMAQVEQLIAEECSVVESREISEVIREIQACCEACICGMAEAIPSFLSFTSPFKSLSSFNVNRNLAD